MSVPAQSSTSAPGAFRVNGGRLDSIDALRGVAIVWMTAYHFCFDLNHFGWIRQNFYVDDLWVWQRTCIVALFMFCAGLGQAVALDQRQGWPRFWRRWGQIAGCALLVTAGSYWMFPKSFIYFGVLHSLALILIVARCTGGWGRWLWPAGALAICAKFAAAAWLPGTGLEAELNSRAWNWLGLVTRKPVTEDYVPLLPWLGVVWWGVASGQWLLRHAAARQRLESLRVPAALAWLGRWSLSWYMLHQPVLIGALMLVGAFR